MWEPYLLSLLSLLFSRLLSLSLSLSLSHSTFSFLNPQSNGVPLASFDASKTSHSMLYLCTLCRLKPSSLSLATSFCALQVSLSPPCVAHLCTRDCRNNEGGRRGGVRCRRSARKLEFRPKSEPQCEIVRSDCALWPKCFWSLLKSGCRQTEPFPRNFESIKSTRRM